ncbi:hypothetical protein ACHAPV_000604 [Trichoderma viride]
MPEPTGMSESKASLSNANSLLETLADAVKEAFMESNQPSASAAKHRQKNVLSDMIGGQSNALALSEASSLPPFLQTSRSSSTQNLPTPAVGSLGGFWGDSLTLRIHNARAATEKLPTDSSTNPSFLGELSKIVAEVSGIDPAAAAKLTDTVLDALHVDSSAVAAAIPKVATEASVSASDLLPLVIPAVAKAMNQPLPPEPPVSTLDMVETLNKVLEQGTTVINDLSRALEDITDPALLAVVNQLALIVSAVADYLDKPLCAVDQVVDGTSFEEVIPCDEVETGSLTSVSQITTLATPGLPESATKASDPEDITTPAAPKPYSSKNQASHPGPTPSSTPTNDIQRLLQALRQNTRPKKQEAQAKAAVQLQQRLPQMRTFQQVGAIWGVFKMQSLEYCLAPSPLTIYKETCHLKNALITVSLVDTSLLEQRMEESAGAGPLFEMMQCDFPNLNVESLAKASRLSFVAAAGPSTFFYAQTKLNLIKSRLKILLGASCFGPYQT